MNRERKYFVATIVKTVRWDNWGQLTTVATPGDEVLIVQHGEEKGYYDDFSLHLAWFFRGVSGKSVLRDFVGKEYFSIVRELTGEEASEYMRKKGVEYDADLKYYVEDAA